MEYKIFVGVDVSKRTIDTFIHARKLHKQFSNDHWGFRELLNWVMKNTGVTIHTDAIICFEHTGLYSLMLAAYLEEVRVPFAMISPLQIKRSLGIARGKTDLIDARRIAEYAYLHREKISPTKLPSKSILKLQPLLTLRNRMVRDRAGYEATQKEQSHFLKDQNIPALFSVYAGILETLKIEIQKVELAIKEILREDEELRQTFELITGVKGVGFVVASYLITYTHNFTRFENWRKFACYSGIAPFENQSGTIRGKTKVSPLANRQIKTMLHMAALRAAHSDSELKVYYQKRVAGGKSKLESINIIRNKVLSRIFAVAKRKTPFVELMRYAA